MEIVKKNMVAIILGVIALAAVAAGFYPLGGMWAELKQVGEGKKGALDEAKGLAGKTRNAPVTSSTGEPRPLDVFPNPRVIEAGLKQVGQIKDNTDQFLKGAMERSKRDLLVPGSLPGVPGQSGGQISFRREYTREMNTLGQFVKTSMPAREMKAGIPPTQEDISAALLKIREEVERDMLQRGVGGGELNRPAVEEEINRRARTLVVDLQKASASRILVYVNATGDSFTVDPNIVSPQTGVNVPPDPSMVFWGQINYWVQQDLCQAIREVNTAPRSDGKAPADVTEAPIKHVLKVTVPPAPCFHGVTPVAPSADGTPVAAPPFDRNAPLVKDFLISFTGRKSGGVIDVVLFNAILVVEADKVPQILERLERTRFFTVERVNSITPVDATINAASGYMYGQAPVVQLDINLEVVFMRDWLREYMPKAVMDLLGFSPPAAPAAGG